MPLLSGFPSGWIDSDALWWGDDLNANTVFSKGARIEVPDMRTADTRTLLALRYQILGLLSGLTAQSAMQIQWSVEDDYHADFDAFEKETETSAKMTRWCRDRRNNRVDFYREMIKRGGLRRERVYLYLAHRCADLRGVSMHSRAARESYLRSALRGLETRMRQMEMSFPIARWTMMDDAGHAGHLRRFLNPSQVHAIASGDVFGELDRTRSVRENCLRSDVMPFPYGYGESRGTGLLFDGHYHAMFVVTRLPSQTRPGMMLDLLDANDRNCSITQNIFPLPVDVEIERLRKELDEIQKSLTMAKSAGLDEQGRLLLARINSLVSSAVIPFKVLTVVRVWADSLEKLSAQALATKGALGRLSGLGYHEVNDPVRARHLFLETLPGHLAGDYRGWDKYCENLNLADFTPVSATFTGHLEEAQALYDSPGGGVVGLRLFAGTGHVPQSTTVTGVNGAGKTAAMIDCLSQVEHMLDYTYIQEEGMAFATYALIRGIPSLAMRESADYTLNPFDTFGLPLTSGNIATVSKTAMKLVGLSSDEDKNKDRENLIGQYTALLFRETAEDFKDRDEDRWMNITRLAMACERSRAPQDDAIDGYLKFRALQESGQDEAKALLASFSEAELIEYQTSPKSRDHVFSMVFSQLAPDEYPQWAGLCDMMKSGRLSVHKRGNVAEILTMLSTSLGQGLRFGGQIGGLIDGVTNVPLFGKGLHLDTSYLSDGMLKEVAGFLFPEMARKHIMTMPRAAYKVMMLDELRRLALIPGAVEHMMEMLAQLRKYRACFVGAFQTISQIEEINPALAAVLMGQCKQHLIFRQNELNEVRKLAKAIGLPEAAQRAVLSHPLLEHQKRGVRASYCTLFSNEGNGNATCGTVRFEVDAPSLYVVSSNGEIFDQKKNQLAGYKDPVDGVYAAVESTGQKEKAA
ncbi:hypothetical protein OPIT5_00305 (plasmid) [Opitutaceae bacterium TAV5]|nr:hypothetical protein OPIT5_00305 [Opitutaceae bacterium TAV5]